jgi:mono/diheme cytochrome c family protein
MVKPLLLVSAATLIFLAAISVPAPVAAGGQAGAKAPPDALAKAKKIFAIDCAMCHNANGDGKTDLAKDMQLTLLDWTNPASLSTKSDQELFDLIRKGKDKMPPEDASRAKDEDIKNLILYIRDLPKEQPAAAAPTAQ